ncbi:MAG: hypothetical protein U5L45_17595 [Saprospiraceae bacterium]|nr:hypothetical protein [Saprospiraceae bacterium]
MLLNLSNHPSVSWTKQQFDAAVEQYGSIKDVPFLQPFSASKGSTDFSPCPLYLQVSRSRRRV